MKHVYEELERQMVKEGITHKDLAILTGVNVRQLKRMIRGYRVMSFDNASLIQARHFPNETVEMLFENYWEGYGNNPITRFLNCYVMFPIYRRRKWTNGRDLAWKKSLVMEVIKDFDNSQMAQAYCMLSRLALNE
jgi:hypothetical protein